MTASRILQKAWARAALLSVILSGGSAFALTITLDSPILYGLPGDAVGWGFTASRISGFAVISSVTYQQTLTTGIFEDLAAPLFQVIGPAPFAFPILVSPYDPVLRTGLGEYRINSFEIVGSQAEGDLVITYDVYSESPNNPIFDPVLHTVSSGNVTTLPAVVVVGSEVPEPATGIVAGLLLCGLAALRRRHQKKGPTSGAHGLLTSIHGNRLQDKRLPEAGQYGSQLANGLAKVLHRRD